MVNMNTDFLFRTKHSFEDFSFSLRTLEARDFIVSIVDLNISDFLFT